jgi:linolenate 9R-lipoxygenase
MFSDCQEILGDLVGDRRTADIEPRFQKIISNIAKFFGTVAQTRGKRATHSFGTVASGTLTVLPDISIPAHRIFAPGNQFAVLLRHANIKGFPDDAIIDGRGATLRILNSAPNDNLNALDLNGYLVDILMSTGRCFFLNNASSFSRWVASPMEERAKMLQEFPKIIPIFHEIIRNPASYTQLHYYSETVYLFKSTDGGKEYFMRYRLMNADRSADTGFVDIKDVRLPVDFLPRLEDDFRPANYLRQEFKQQVTNKGVKYILQIQLQPVTDSKEANETAKDCTLPWDESLYPFQDVATLDLKSIVPDEIAEGLEFNPYHGTNDLSLILAYSIDETASINHLRSVVYQISANMRKYQSPSAELVDWGTVDRPSPQALFPYYGKIGDDLPRFDPALTLPPRVAPKPRLVANIGLSAIPAKAAPPLDLLGISGVTDIIKQLQTPNVMPANLTRCRPDKFSDEFFVERRLNGFNPGKFKPADHQPWQYVIRFDCRKHKVEQGGIFPALIEARFVLESHQLKVHSIQYELDHQTLTRSPGDADWEWSKKLFRSAEFVFQETQSHLARTHLNVEQYAMAYYRNIANNPIRLLLEPHLEGLLNINKVGDSVIFGATGVIPGSSALDEIQVALLLKEEISRLTYRNWHPHSQTLKTVVTNNHFDRAALAVWKIMEEYVGGFFATHEADILKAWPEIQAMSQDLVSHSILAAQYGTLAIDNIQDLRQLCIYVIYHSSFLHSWVNYKQYEDGGDVDYASLGLWDSHNSAYNPISVTQKHVQQVLIAWTLSNVRYNPVMENGNPVLKDLFWKHRNEITPGLALDSIMMSIHI